MEGADTIEILVLIGSIVFVVTGALVVCFMYMDKNRRLQRSFELLRSQVAIQEQAFNNISSEIHDNIGQSLSLAKLNLGTVEPELAGPVYEKIRCSRELVGRAITDLRNLSRKLSAEMISQEGLEEAIRKELVIMSRTGRVRTRLKQQGRSFRFDRQKEIIIFRLFQELIAGIVSHGDAKTVIVRLYYGPQVFNLIVSDDGRAMTEEELHGAGIRNMQSRALLIGANFEFSCNPPKGNVACIAIAADESAIQENKVEGIN